MTVQTAADLTESDQSKTLPPTGIITSALFLVFVLGFLTLVNPAALAELNELSKQELSDVSGREGIAFQMEDWRATSGNLSVTWFQDAPFGSVSFSDNHISLSSIRWNDPHSYSKSYPSTEINPVCGPQRGANCSTPPQSEPGVNFGTLTDPMTINVTNENEGIIAMRFPGTESNMERVNVGFDVHMNDQYLATATIGNALWAGGTQLEVQVNPGGGVNLGIDMQLDGDVWAFTQSSPGSSEALTAQGVFGAQTYTPGNGNLDQCCSHDQFTGALSWADINGNRPLKIDFVNDQIQISLSSSNPSAGTLGVNSLELNETDLGTSVIADVRISELQITGPTN